MKPFQQLIKRSLPLSQSLPVYTVVHVVPIALRCHEAGISQDLEMLGHSALRHAKAPSERADAQIPFLKQEQHAKPRFDG